MSKRIVRTFLALAFALGCSGLATAQMPPGDPGLGNKLGIQEMNNSGEAGEVTLFGRNGGRSTLVVVNVQGSPHRPQPLGIHRARTCESAEPAAAFHLNNLVNGHSATLLPNVAILRLLSGNYSVMIGSQMSNPTHYVSCGHLYT